MNKSFIYIVLNSFRSRRMENNVSYNVQPFGRVDNPVLLINTTVEETDSNDGILALIEKIAIPLITLFGIIGNTLSFMVFTRASISQNSCSFFLAARSVSDNGFLVSLFLIWLSSILGFQNVVGLCHTFSFFMYVFNCLSVWLVVLVTAENYIRICKPFLVNKVCKVFNAKALVVVIILLIMGFYSFPFWSMTESCVLEYRQIRSIQGMIYADSLLTFVAPIVIMTTLIVAVVITTIKSYKRRRRLSALSIKCSRNPITKVAKMLLGVTLVFFLLNIPSHALRLKHAVQTVMHNNTITDVSSLDVAMHSISLLMYYTSLAINVIIYYRFGVKFRLAFLEIVCRRPARRNSEEQFTKSESLMHRRAIRLSRLNCRLMSDSFLKRPTSLKRQVSVNF